MSTFNHTPDVEMGALEEGFSFGGCLPEILPELFDKNKSYDADSLDAYWMKQAFIESMKSVGLCNPNPAVGCVIVKDGQLITRGHTQAYGGKHAERHAFDQLTDRSMLEGATAYVTLEPCSHHGNQPPCADLLASSGIERVVISRGDPDSRVSGRGVEKLLQSKKKVVMGILASETTAWNYPFFKTATRTRPFFGIKWAQTIDGQLADDEGVSQWISGVPARRYTHWLRQKYDAVLVGVGTYLKDASSLTVRDCDMIRRQPLRLIYDPNSRLLEASGPAHEKLLNPPQEGLSPYIIFTASETGRHRLQEAYPAAVCVAVNGESMGAQIEAGLISTDVLQIHGKRVQSVLIEGGAKTLTEIVRAGYVDLAHVFISSSMTGGRKNRIAPGLSLSSAVSFRNISTHSLGNDVLIEMVPCLPS